MIDLPPELTALLLPFSMVIDPAGCLAALGPRLTRLVPGITPGRPLREFFQATRPAVPLEYDVLRARTNSLFVLKAADRDVKLRGQFLHHGGRDVLLFCGGPVIADVAGVRHLGLSLSDLPLHEPTGDFLLQLQLAHMALGDARRTAERLTEENAALGARAGALAESALAGVLSGLSRDLAADVATVFSALRLLRVVSLSPDVQALLQGTQEAADALLRHLGDLGDLVEVLGPSLPLLDVPFSPADVLAALRVRLCEAAAQRGFALEFTGLAVVPPWLRGDPARIEAVLQRLLEEFLFATDHAPDRAGTLRIGLEVEGSGLRFSVSEHPSPERSPSSAGHRAASLGVTICQRLIARMGGALLEEHLQGLEHKVRKFSFTLPLPVAPPPAKDAASASEAVAVPSRLSVLLVQGQPEDQAATRRALERLGVKVTLAQSGRQAIEVFRPGEFALVLLDLALPDQDGLRLAALLRARDAGAANPAASTASTSRQRTPLVALSGGAMAGERERCLAAGLDDHLIKPPRLADLAAVLSRWCGILNDRRPPR